MKEKKKRRSGGDAAREAGGRNSRQESALKWRPLKGGIGISNQGRVGGSERVFAGREGGSGDKKEGHSLRSDESEAGGRRRRGREEEEGGGIFKKSPRAKAQRKKKQGMKGGGPQTGGETRGRGECAPLSLKRVKIQKATLRPPRSPRPSLCLPPPARCPPPWLYFLSFLQIHTGSHSRWTTLPPPAERWGIIIILIKNKSLKLAARAAGSGGSTATFFVSFFFYARLLSCLNKPRFFPL